MGKIKQGILGAFSGKVAGVVGTSWKGIAVMKALPPSVANPQTAPQMAQRNKFSSAVAFAKVILSIVIKPLWDRFAQQMSGYNAFIKANIDTFSASGLSTPADLIISNGKMAGGDLDSAAITHGSTSATVAWTDNSGTGFKQATDEPFVVYWNETQDKLYGFAPDQTREDTTAMITLGDEQVTGDDIHVWLAFRRDDGTVTGQTDYYAETIS